MSHIIQIPDDIYEEVASYAAQHGQTPDAFLMSLVRESVESLKQGETPPSLHAIRPEVLSDPLDAFVGAFDLGDDDPGWIERHDEYFVYDEGEHGNKQ